MIVAGDNVSNGWIFGRVLAVDGLWAWVRPKARHDGRKLIDTGPLTFQLADLTNIKKEEAA